MKNTILTIVVLALVAVCVGLLIPPVLAKPNTIQVTLKDAYTKQPISGCQVLITVYIGEYNELPILQGITDERGIISWPINGANFGTSDVYSVWTVDNYLGSFMLSKQLSANLHFRVY